MVCDRSFDLVLADIPVGFLCVVDLPVDGDLEADGGGAGASRAGALAGFPWRGAVSQVDEDLKQLVDELLALQFCERLLEDQVSAAGSQYRAEQFSGYLETVRQMCADRRCAVKGKL